MHGNRVAACVSELVKLDLDVRSTAAYGVAHILASLTVTNRELRAIALADKDISPEQYDQMQELQRIKTRDEAGNVIEEKKVLVHPVVSCDDYPWMSNEIAMLDVFLNFTALLSPDGVIFRYRNAINDILLFACERTCRRIATWTQRTCAAVVSSASWPAMPLSSSQSS